MEESKGKFCPKTGQLMTADIDNAGNLVFISTITRERYTPDNYSTRVYCERMDTDNVAKYETLLSSALDDRTNMKSINPCKMCKTDTCMVHVRLGTKLVKICTVCKNKYT